MAYTKKKLEDLNVMDDFLMNSLATDRTVGEEFCRVLLSTLLQRDIGKVHVTVQKVIPPGDPNLKGIRLDVKVEEPILSKETGNEAGMNLYDIEPHLLKGTDLPRHNRFYQAMTDSSNLKSGENDFKNLPDLYIIMILNKDPFGYDYMMYRIRNKCEEVAELEYEDGLRFYYFYTGGHQGGNNAIKTMLHYIRDSRIENATDTATQEIHKYTEAVKIHPEVRKSYMFWEEYVEILKEELKEALIDEVREEVREETKKELRKEIEAETKRELRKEIKAETERELRGKIKAETERKLRGKFEAETILSLLGEYGEVPVTLQEKILKEQDLSVLRFWLKIAARVNSIQEFEAAVQK